MRGFCFSDLYHSAISTKTKFATLSTLNHARMHGAGFPPGPSGDQVVSLLNGPLAFLNTTRQQYGSIVGLLLGGERVVLVSDPQAAKQVWVAAHA